MEPQSTQAKLYILVRNDLPVPVQFVQAAHVIESWSIGARTLLRLNNYHKPTTFALLSVRNEAELRVWLRKIEQKNITVTYFCEPDIGNQMTSLCAYTDTNIFSGLPLWTEKAKEEPSY